MGSELMRTSLANIGSSCICPDPRSKFRYMLFTFIYNFHLSLLNTTMYKTEIGTLQGRQGNLSQPKCRRQQTSPRTQVLFMTNPKLIQNRLEQRWLISIAPRQPTLFWGRCPCIAQMQWRCLAWEKGLTKLNYQSKTFKLHRNTLLSEIEIESSLVKVQPLFENKHVWQFLSISRNAWLSLCLCIPPTTCRWPLWPLGRHDDTSPGRRTDAVMRNMGSIIQGSGLK